MCLSEIFIRQGSLNNVVLKNFKLASNYHRDKGRGGTCILIKKHYETKCIPFVTQLATKFYFECCGIEIIGTGVIVINIYRIPEQTSSHVGVFLHKLENVLNYLTYRFKHKKKCYLRRLEYRLIEEKFGVH